MPHPRYSNEEIVRRGQEIYERRLRLQLEDGNEGKVLAIDVETGDYELDSDEIAASRRAMAKSPGHALYLMRIGYESLYGFNGGPRQTKR